MKKKILANSYIYRISYLVGIILKLFYVIPIKTNQIFFISYDGKQFSCNPKYIYLKLRDDEKIKKIWVLKNKYDYNNALSNDTIVVSPYSFLYFFFILTSKYIISNNGIKTFVPLRKSQIYIETWHGGGAYKKTGIDVNTSTLEIKKIKKLSEKTTFFISSSQKVTETKSIAHMLDINKFLNIGTPRNDFLLANKNSNDTILKRKILDKLNLNESVKIVLYAPTFRNKIGGNINDKFEKLNIKQCINSLKLKFGSDWILLYRAHHTVIQIKDDCINVSDYDDMQELLYISDVLISDYSSSMWDFSFTYKPCFVYAADLDDYSKERSFYTNPNQWPYPIARNNLELDKCIKDFDYHNYKAKVSEHHRKQGSFEKGTASEYIYNLIKRG